MEKVDSHIEQKIYKDKTKHKGNNLSFCLNSVADMMAEVEKQAEGIASIAMSNVEYQSEVEEEKSSETVHIKSQCPHCGNLYWRRIFDLEATGESSN